MKINLNSFLMSVSTALDYAEEEIMSITAHHSKRCAFIALRIGLELKMSEEECFDLCSLALLHDNGITQAFLAQDFLEAGSSKNLALLERLSDHCRIGEENIKSFPFLNDPDDVILYHHEYIDGSGVFGLKGDEIPFMSQIICFADEIDMQFELGEFRIDDVSTVVEYLKSRSHAYSPKIIEAFSAIVKKISFWGELSDENIINAFESWLPRMDAEIELEDILTMSSVFSAIIDAKSAFTAMHSNDLMHKAKETADYLGFDRDRALKFQIAANLHDIGKLKTPREILEKESTLLENEFETIKEHAYITHVLLKSIEGFEEIHQWASAHHERIDGSGYPFKIEGNRLCFESQLLAALDMYQALVEDRPYREALIHEDAIAIMSKEVDAGRFSPEIIEIIESIFRL